MTEKPEIVFVVENKLGGITSFNKNIIENTSLRDKAIFKVILVDQADASYHRLKDPINADEVIPFTYTSVENRYYVLKRFHKLLGNRPGAIFCNDGMEMQAIRLFGSGEKTVYQMIHDFYNLKLAVKVPGVTDVYLSHTQLFHDALMSSDPVAVQSFCIPHGVRIKEDYLIQPPGKKLRLVFVGRLSVAKGVMDLSRIDDQLRQSEVLVDWMIIGKGDLKSELEKAWAGRNNVSFYAPDSNEEVIKLMGENDAFILPTHFEGFPVTLLEAMSLGLVPLVSDLPGGIRENITEDIGFRIPVGNMDGFVDAIKSLNSQIDAIIPRRKRIRERALDKFDIRKTSDRYIETLLKFRELKRQGKLEEPFSIGFRLDQRWLPNALVKLVRNTQQLVFSKQ